MSTDTSPLLTPSVPTPTARRRDRSRWFVVGVIAVVALLIGATVLLVRGGGGTDVVTPGAPPSASAPATTEPTTPPTSAPTPAPAPGGQVDRTAAVWPWAGSGTSYATPVDAARGFAQDFLGMRAPVSVGAFRPGDSRSGEVDVRPTPNGPATTVLVRRLSGEESWSVLGAATVSIQVTQPEALTAISSPVTVRGSALAFEGHVDVAVRQDGTGAPLGTGYVTGGGDRMRSFEGSVAFERPSAELGALVLSTASAEDGRLWQATVLRVRLSATTVAPASCGGLVPATPSPGPGEMVVSAFFTCDPQATADPAPFRVQRVVPASPGVLRASLLALLAGPTARETDAGVSSFFSPATAGMLRGVSLGDGHAVVDLGDLPSVIPNASTSAGSALLLSELDATAFQFPTVRSVEYRLAGSCSAFTDWLQLGSCTPRTR